MGGEGEVSACGVCGVFGWGGGVEEGWEFYLGGVSEK